MKSFSEITSNILRVARSEFRADVAAITFNGKPSGSFHHVLLTQYSDQSEVFSTVGRPLTFCDVIFESCEPVSAATPKDAPGGTACPLMLAEGLVAYLGVPLLADGRCVGALEVMDATAREWTPEDQIRLAHHAELFQLLGAQGDEDHREAVALKP